MNVDGGTAGIGGRATDAAGLDGTKDVPMTDDGVSSDENGASRTGDGGGTSETGGAMATGGATTLDGPPTTRPYSTGGISASSSGFGAGGVANSGGTTGTGGVAVVAAGPCDIYAAANTPCAAAYSMTRLLSSKYRGPLYQVRSGSSSSNTGTGGTPQDIGAMPDGYADSATQDAFCLGTLCTVSVLYDQSGNGNHLKVAPKGPAISDKVLPFNYESPATTPLPSPSRPPNTCARLHLSPCVAVQIDYGLN